MMGIGFIGNAKGIKMSATPALDMKVFEPLIIYLSP